MSSEEADHEILKRKVNHTTDMARIGIYMAVIVYLLGSMEYLEFIQETYSMSGVEYFLVAFGGPILALAVVTGVILFIVYYRVERLKEKFNGTEE